MPQGSITDYDRSFVETWENIAPSANAVIRLDSRGMEKHEFITGRRTFLITTEERLITQDRIVADELDPFRNGCFRPVMVPDSVSTDTNPNALSDDEIKSVLVSSDLAWGEWMKVIDSPETLRRMVDVADESDISLRRYKELATKLSEAKPRTQVTQKDREQYEQITGGAADTGRQQRRRGGMSSDYRAS